MNIKKFMNHLQEQFNFTQIRVKNILISQKKLDDSSTPDEREQIRDQYNYLCGYKRAISDIQIHLMKLQGEE